MLSNVVAFDAHKTFVFAAAWGRDLLMSAAGDKQGEPVKERRLKGQRKK